MKKALCLSVLLLMTVSVMSGCMFFTDDHSWVATVNGTDIPYAKYYELYDSYATMYEQNYGMDRNDPQYDEYFGELRDGILNSLVQAELIRQQCVDHGILPLSQENRDKAKKYLDEDIRAYKDQFIAAEKKADGTSLKTDEQYEQLADEEMQRFYENQKTSYEKLLEEYCTNVATELLQEEIVKSVTVSDTEAQEYYNQALADQKEEFKTEEDYEDAAYYGETIYTVPFEGYRYVSHILFAFSEETQTAISTARTAAATAKNSADKETDATKKAEYMATYEAKTKEADDLVAEAVADSAMKERVDAFYSRLANGEKYEDLLKELSDDAGGTGTDGYLVGPKTTTYVKPFVAEALRLSAANEISTTAITTDFGCHVMRLELLVEKGDVPFETLKEGIVDELLSSKRADEWDTQLKNWEDTADIKYNDAALGK